MPREQPPVTAELVSQGGFDQVDWQISEPEGREKYTFAHRVLGRVGQMGITRAERPQITKDHIGLFAGLKVGQYFDGRLPPVIRRLSLDQISTLYSLFSNWSAYLITQMHNVMAERSEAKRQRDLVWAMVRQQYKWDPDNTDNQGRPKKRMAQEMSDLARLDSRFVEVDAKYEEANILYYYLEAMVMVAEQDMKVISREVTIQQAKAEHDHAQRGMAGRFSAVRSIGERQAFNREQEDLEGPDHDTEDQNPSPPPRGNLKPSPIRIPLKAK